MFVILHHTLPSLFPSASRVILVDKIHIDGWLRGWWRRWILDKYLILKKSE